MNLTRNPVLEPESARSASEAEVHLTFRRSLINREVSRAQEVLRSLHISLPRFADWTPKQWESAGEETREIRECMLGWDVTDFGSNRFPELGRTLFTLRNGKYNN